MSLYKQIVDIESQEDLKIFWESSLIADELTKDISALLFGTGGSISALKYLAYAYDSESELISTYAERTVLKNVAARKAGFNTTEDRIIKIVLNKDNAFNEIIGFYLRHTLPLEWQIIINLEDVLDEMLSMIRPRKDYDEKMPYDVFMNAVTAKGNAALKAVQVMETLVELKKNFNLKDKNIHQIGFEEIGQPEREKRPEDVLKERMKKQPE